MDQTPTLFMRIHKTASESLAKQICDRLPAGVDCPAHFEWQVRNLPLTELRRFGFFHGHISPAALSDTLAHLQVVTMLRCPRERLLSCFFYWKDGSKRTRSEFFDSIAGLSLLDFLRSEQPVIRRATWNVQARLVAGGQFGGIDGQRQNVYGPWLSETALTAEAVRALDRFGFVGITDRYAASLRGVYALLNLGEPPPPEYLNATCNRPASYSALLSDPEIADALTNLTAVDQIVYDTALCRLNDYGATAGSARSS